MARIVTLRSRRKPVPKGAGFTIDKDVPIPALRRKSVYPFEAMRVGDSFTVPPEKRTTVSAAAAQYKVRNKTWNYTTRVQVDGLVRIWRTK